MFSLVFSFQTPLPKFSLNVRYEVQHLYQTADRIIALYILNFIILGFKLEDRALKPNSSSHSMNLICF